MNNFKEIKQQELAQAIINVISSNVGNPLTFTELVIQLSQFLEDEVRRMVWNLVECNELMISRNYKIEIASKTTNKAFSK